MKKTLFIYADSPRSHDFGDYLINLMERLGSRGILYHVKTNTAKWEGRLKKIQEKIDDETARGTDGLLVCLSHALLPDDLPPLVDAFIESGRPIAFMKVGDAFYDERGVLEEFLRSKGLYSYEKFSLVAREDDLTSLM